MVQLASFNSAKLKWKLAILLNYCDLLLPIQRICFSVLEYIASNLNVTYEVIKNFGLKGNLHKITFKNSGKLSIATVSIYIIFLELHHSLLSCLAKCS